MRQFIVYILSPILTALLISCYSGKEIKQEVAADYLIEQINIDSGCIDHLAKMLQERYGFKAKEWKCQRTSKYLRTVYFTNEIDSNVVAKAKNRKRVVWSDDGVLIVLSDSCNIDTLIWSIQKK